jgi:hypothetical protein
MLLREKQKIMEKKSCSDHRKKKHKKMKSCWDHKSCMRRAAEWKDVLFDTFGQN